MVKELNPARNIGESYEAYTNRRRKINKAIKYHLRGRLVFQSVVIEPEHNSDGIVIGYTKVASQTYVTPKE